MVISSQSLPLESKNELWSYAQKKKKNNNIMICRKIFYEFLNLI